MVSRDDTIDPHKLTLIPQLHAILIYRLARVGMSKETTNIRRQSALYWDEFRD